MEQRIVLLMCLPEQDVKLLLEIRAPELPLRLNICGGVAGGVRGPASAKEGPFGIIIQHRTTTDSSACAGRRLSGIWVTCGNF